MRFEAFPYPKRLQDFLRYELSDSATKHQHPARAILYLTALPAILISSSTHKQGSKDTPWQDEFDVDNGWFGIAVPTKTTSITLTLSNGQDGLFAPTAFIDYEKAKITPPPVVAVPEPGTYALMAACLGVLGLSMRRAQRPTV